MLKVYEWNITGRSKFSCTTLINTGMTRFANYENLDQSESATPPRIDIFTSPTILYTQVPGTCTPACGHPGRHHNSCSSSIKLVKWYLLQRYSCGGIMVCKLGSVAYYHIFIMYGIVFSNMCPMQDRLSVK